MTPRILLCLAAAAALAPAPFAQAQTAPAAKSAAWTPFTPPEGMFTIDYPAPPQRTENPVAEGPGSPGKVVMFTSASPVGVFLAGWADYAPSFTFDAQAELTANRDNFVKGVEGKLLASKAITLNGAPGMEFDVEKPGAWMARARVYVFGKRPYQLISINSGATVDAAQAARFFVSFKLLPPR